MNIFHQKTGVPISAWSCWAFDGARVRDGVTKNIRRNKSSDLSYLLVIELVETEKGFELDDGELGKSKKSRSMSLLWAVADRGRHVEETGELVALQEVLEHRSSDELIATELLGRRLCYKGAFVLNFNIQFPVGWREFSDN